MNGLSSFDLYSKESHVISEGFHSVEGIQATTWNFGEKRCGREFVKKKKKKTSKRNKTEILRSLGNESRNEGRSASSFSY